MARLNRLALGISLVLALSAGTGCGLQGGLTSRGDSKVKAGAARASMHAPGMITLFAQPESGTLPVVKAINDAKRSVWLQIYMLTDAQVMDALSRAAERGVDVRVLLEESPFNPGNPNSALSTNKETARQLEVSGVRVAWTNPQFNFTHAKAMLVDGDTAYVLTYNLTKAATQGNREFGVIDRALSDVEELKRIFLADWNRQPYQPLDPDLVVSPNNARWRITALMESAQKELLVGVEVISDPEIMALLQSKRKAGVDVRLLVGGVKKIVANQPPARALAASGMPVRSQGRPYLHAKYVIADGQSAYLGSINFSTNSLDENRELGLIINEPAAIGKLRDVWFADWEKSDPITDAPVKPAQKRSGETL